MTRFVTIGRHEFTPRQKQLLQKAGLAEEAERIAHVNNPAEVVKIAKERGAKAIVVQALPMHILAQLLQAAQREGIEVLQFQMETLATVKENEACPKGTEVESEVRGSELKRCIRTKALVRVKRIVIETEPVAE